MMNIGKKYTMIRWYDYLAAFLAADLLWLNIKIALYGGPFLGPLAGISAYFMWKAWDIMYIPFRYQQEYGNR